MRVEVAKDSRFGVRAVCSVELAKLGSLVVFLPCESNQMVLAELVQQLEAIEPGVPASHTARMLLLIVQSCGDSLEELTDRASVEAVLQPIQMQLQSALDQESAVAEELDQLASTRPAEFNPSHVWTLIRAIKVQKQVLDLFVCSEPQLA